MRVGFLKSADDPRCPLSDIALRKYGTAKIELLAESGIGEKLGRSFPEIEKSRQEILASADIIYSNQPLEEDEIIKLKKDAFLISFYAPFNPDFKHGAYQGHDFHVFSMDMIPRTTLAQSMDVLSSMASIAGYKSVLLAATKLPRYFPMLMTAAGTIRPANILILGAGVAGLQAIATARRLGARVFAFDVRSAVKDEVQSLGAKFVEVEGAKDDSSAGGYAVEQSAEYKAKQQDALRATVAKSDVVITTAQIRGRVAPILLDKAMVESMPYGSVIIDLAASTGGNCELTVDKKETEHKGVTIIGDSYLYLSALQDASDLLSNNIRDYVSLFNKDNKAFYNAENEILAKSLIYSKT